MNNVDPSGHCYGFPSVVTWEGIEYVANMRGPSGQRRTVTGVGLECSETPGGWIHYIIAEDAGPYCLERNKHKAMFEAILQSSTVSGDKSLKTLLAIQGLKSTARLQYPWIYFVPGALPVATARIETAINIIIAYKSTINLYAVAYSVPASIIAGIILKEQFTQSIPDSVANIDTWIRSSSHSVGLGAIFPSTARSAWEYVNPWFTLPSSDKNLQYTLTYNDSFNIQTIAVVLIHKAKLAGYLGDSYNSADVKNLTMTQWKKAVAKYNGADIYADKVWEYLPYFDIILK